MTPISSRCGGQVARRGVMRAVRVREHLDRATEQRTEQRARVPQLFEHSGPVERRQPGMRRRVRSELDAPRLHRAELAGVERGLLDPYRYPRVGPADALRHEENRGPEAVLLQQGERNIPVGAVAVVEGDDDWAAWQPSGTMAVGEIVREGNAFVAPPPQERELRFEPLRSDIAPRVAGPGRDAIDLMVEEDRELHRGSQSATTIIRRRAPTAPAASVRATGP